MKVISTKFSILLATKNRLDDFYVAKVVFSDRTDVECVICDDGWIHHWYYNYIIKNHPKYFAYQSTFKGYLYCRDKMLNETQADFAISFG
jgi:hypothetical protein